MPQFAYRDTKNVKLKCKITPITIGVTGIVIKVLKKHLEAIPGKHSVDSLNKAAVLGTSHVKRKVVQCETGCLSGGAHRWFKRSAREKRTVTRGNNNSSNIIIIIIIIIIIRPPLWSSGQSFWLQIQRSRVRFPALPDFSE